MNTSIVISFVIGGIVLLSVLAFNQMISDNSRENTLSIVTHQNLDTVVDFITSDFERIGYDPTGTLGENQYILTYQDDRLVFNGDVYTQDSVGVTTVTWVADTSDPVTNTSNPNDFYLKRTGPSTSSGASSTSEIPVVYFNLTYYNDLGNPPTMSRHIYKIKVEVVIESPEPIRVNANGEEVYYKAVWNRTFSPNHLNKRLY